MESKRVCLKCSGVQALFYPLVFSVCYLMITWTNSFSVHVHFYNETASAKNLYIKYNSDG